MKFGSYLRQVGGFLRVLRFPPSMKLIIQDDIAETLLKVALNTIALTPPAYIMFVYYLC
jgi:hypothetical protein